MQIKTYYCLLKGRVDLSVQKVCKNDFLRKKVMFGSLMQAIRNLSRKPEIIKNLLSVCSVHTVFKQWVFEMEPLFLVWVYFSVCVYVCVCVWRFGFVFYTHFGLAHKVKKTLTRYLLWTIGVLNYEPVESARAKSHIKQIAKWKLLLYKYWCFKKN